MEIRILQLIEGAKQARGLTVIIDVFRAFSLECYLTAMGAAELRPVRTVEEAFAFRRRDPQALLVGERHGVKCEGFDFGNSPSSVTEADVRGRRIIHTTSAGTQGIVNAVYADQIITGSLVNARAVADYLRSRAPQTVSLVCMGNEGVREAPEDTLCAQYIRSLLEDRPMPEIDRRILELREHGGEHFFDPARQSVFPERDFWLCIRRDVFPFVLRAEWDAEGAVMKQIRLR